MLKGERIKAKAFYDRLKRICQWNGITFRSPHKIRKTYVSALIDAGVPHPLIMSQVGHTDFAQTTERCYHFNRYDAESNNVTIGGAVEKMLANG